jgi:DNA polymerase III sliding clamp (beta) subunit (PCNA family)
MQINKKDLQTALEIVKPGLDNKETIEQANSFAFIDGKVVTYNDEISISHTVKGLDITGAIQANELYKLLGKLKDDEIEIDVSENEIQVKSGRAKAWFTLQSEIKLPIESIGKIGKWLTLPENFNQAMKFTMSSCSRNMTQPLLTCVHVSEIGCEATDNFRIAQYLFNTPLKAKLFIVPANSVAVIVKMKPIQISNGEGWVHFKNEIGTVLSCRVFENDEYPDVSQFLKVKGSKVTFPYNTVEILERAMIFSKTDSMLDESVDVSIDGKRFELSSQSTNGKFKESVRCDYASEPINFMIIPYLLKDILNETLNCTISKDRLKFEGDNWKYVTMLTQGSIVEFKNKVNQEYEDLKEAGFEGSEKDFEEYKKTYGKNLKEGHENTFEELYGDLPF